MDNNLSKLSSNRSNGVVSQRCKPLRLNSLHKYLCCAMPILSSSSSLTAGCTANNLNTNNYFTDIKKIIGCMEELQNKAGGNKIDLLFLGNLLKGEDMESLIKIHNNVTAPLHNSVQLSANQNANKLIADIIEDLHTTTTTTTSISDEARELMKLLVGYEFQGLIQSHDFIASKCFLPTLPELADQVDEDEVSVKIIKLLKGSKEPLGATIKSHPRTGRIHIARIMKGGAADRSAIIKVGDELAQVNDVNTKGKDPNTVVAMLTNSNGPLTLKLIAAPDYDMIIKDTQMFVRTCFDFDPKTNSSIPCKEVGLSFKRNDILIIVCQDDSSWWQASRLEDEKNVGLIPSIKLLERIEADGNRSVQEIEKKLKFSPKIVKRKKPKKDEVAENLITVGGVTPPGSGSIVVIPTYYERVERLQMNSDSMQRNIIIVGHPLLIRNEILLQLQSKLSHLGYKLPPKSKLTQTDRTDKTTTATTTTQPIIVDNLEFKNYSLAIKLDDIRNIIKEERKPFICGVNRTGLALLRSGEFKPYCIFLKLCEKTSKMKKLEGNETYEGALNENLILEKKYSYCFDTVVNVGKDLVKTADEIATIVKQINSKPFTWVPSDWILN